MNNVITIRSWQGISSVEDAKILIDTGILLKWKEMRTLKRNFSIKNQSEIITHMTKRLCERTNDRLSSEIIIESMLIWLAHSPSHELINCFIDQIFEEPNRAEACLALVTIAFTTESIEEEHKEAMLAAAVLLICELGLAIFEYESKYPNEFSQAKKILSNIESYLLSVSNLNHMSIRLSLVNYFGQTDRQKDLGSSFSKIMARFGHTVLEHLFVSLFQKKSEAMALQYLLENLSFVLEADRHCQIMLNDLFKSYMLKNPERFILFLKSLSNHMIAQQEQMQKTRKILLQHLGSLIQVSNDLNHKELIRELLVIISTFDSDPFRNELFLTIEKENEIKPFVKEILSKIKSARNKQDLDSKIAKMSHTKRGRKPSFAKISDISTLDQVCFLSNLAS